MIKLSILDILLLASGVVLGALIVDVISGDLDWKGAMERGFWIVIIFTILKYVFREREEGLSERQLILLGVVRDLGPSPSFQISLEAQRRLGKPISIGSLFKELHKLVRKGFLRTSKDGQRSTYQITEEGSAAVEEHIRSFTSKYTRPSGDLGV